MMTRRLVRGAAGIAAVAAGLALGRYHREIVEIRRRVGSGGQVADTARGPIEYGIEGEGLPVLIVHGAAGGYDQGLLLARAFAPPGVRVIAPSRFGYLKTPLPADASPAAQADAHVALLDSLAIGSAVVVGVSAGAPSAVEMALNHPRRVRGLVLAVPRLYAPGMPALPLRRRNLLFAKLILSSDLAYWSALVLLGDGLVRRMGVPTDRLTRSRPEERSRVVVMMRSVLPVGRRRRGLKNDLATKMVPRPIDAIDVPSLIIASRDDLFDTLPAAQHLADRIPNARLIVFDRGGHFLVDRREEVMAAVAALLTELREAEEMEF